MTTRDILDEIEQRASKATPGPWWPAEEIDGYRAGQRTVIRAKHGYTSRRIATVDQTRPHFSGPAEANIAFAAHARTDVPNLVAALRVVLDECDIADRLTQGEGAALVSTTRIRQGITIALGSKS